MLEMIKPYFHFNKSVTWILLARLRGSYRALFVVWGFSYSFCLLSSSEFSFCGDFRFVYKFVVFQYYLICFMQNLKLQYFGWLL